MDDDKYKPMVKDLMKIRRDKNAKKGMVYGFFHILRFLLIKPAPHISRNSSMVNNVSFILPSDKSNDPRNGNFHLDKYLTFVLLVPAWL